jgi:hypothetical protein
MRSILPIGFLTLITGILIAISCQKSDNNEPVTPPVTNKPIEYVTASISGRILDDNNQPVTGAVVKAGTATTTSDTSGNFRINNVSLDKNAGFVKVEKGGFFQGSRTIVVNAGAVNYLSIQLIKRTVSGTVSGSSGGNVTVPSGGSIAFTGNSFVNTAGNAVYTGTVSVSTYLINPTASNFNDIMPGTLRGINTSNEETGLHSFGIMAVELTGTGGEKLQLGAGKTATLTFPIPAALQANAPATIALWSFNDTTGLWKEDGFATKQGTNYVGTVGHFSFCNSSFSYPLVDLTAVIKDQNGNALYPAKVVLKTTIDTVTTVGYAYTDTSGRVGVKILSGKALVLKVYNKCNNLIYTKEIGPFTSATADLGVIKVDNPAGQLTITGKVINCKALPVTNGFVDISLDSVHYRATVTNGSFSTTIARCNNTPATAVLTAYDLTDEKVGNATNFAITSSNVNIGQITSCGSSMGYYLTYTINGVTTSFVAPADSLTWWTSMPYPNQFTVWATSRTQSANQSVFVQFITPGTGTGIGTAKEVVIYAGQKYYLNKSSLPTINMNITDYAPSSGIFSGNFTGMIKDSFANANVNASLLFRVKK